VGNTLQERTIEVGHGSLRIFCTYIAVAAAKTCHLASKSACRPGSRMPHYTVAAAMAVHETI